MAKQANVQDWEAITNAKFKGDSNARADALEHKMMQDLERIPRARCSSPPATEIRPGRSRTRCRPVSTLCKGPIRASRRCRTKPTLMDFFRLRFGSATNHLLQSANLARKGGYSEKVVLACLLHDIGVVGFIRSDHGYWGAQLIEPYVDEEISWAIRYHQALRFFPDKDFGYEYPEMYVRLFGDGFDPEPYIKRDYEFARKHKWYGTARQICVNDLYAFETGRRSETRGVRGHHRP